MKLVLLAVAGLLLAGCIAPESPTRSSVQTAAVPADRVDGMTVDVTKTDKDVPCNGNSTTVDVPASCAERDLLAKGRIGVDSLFVDLRGMNGPITVEASSDDSWSFHAIVRVREPATSDARASLDKEWNWTHVEGGKHVLKAGPAGSMMLPTGIPSLTNGLVSARYDVQLPAWVALELHLRTSNAPLEITGLQATSVDAQTSNGPIGFQGQAKDVVLKTSNGPATLTLQPTQSGSVSLDTSNGPIAAQLLEDGAHGYDLDAKTSNGKIIIDLQDGDVTQDSGTRGQTSAHAHFTTHGIGSRAVQTTMTLATSNGPVTVG